MSDSNTKNNTVISYMYRDASNYKTSIEFVLPGTIDPDVVMGCCDEGEYFIPSQVGLPNIQHQMISFPGGDDHVWHELDKPEMTDREPTTEILATELQEQFEEAKDCWNVLGACREIGLV